MGKEKRKSTYKKAESNKADWWYWILDAPWWFLSFAGGNIISQIDVNYLQLVPCWMHKFSTRTKSSKKIMFYFPPLWQQQRLGSQYRVLSTSNKKICKLRMKEKEGDEKKKRRISASKECGENNFWSDDNKENKKAEIPCRSLLSALRWSESDKKEE